MLKNTKYTLEYTERKMVEVKNPVIEDLKKRIDEAGSQKAVAEEMGISPSHLSDVLAGKRNLGEELLEQLGYEKVIVHVKAHAVPDVVRAIETAQSEVEHIHGLKKRIFRK
jgi:hypothetical protein